MPWEVTDYNVWRRASGPAAAQGEDLILSIGTSPAIGFVWLVTGITVACTQPVTANVPNCQVFDQDPTAVLGGAMFPPADATRYGILDINDRASPLIIPSGGGIWVVWFGVDLGAIAQVRVQYEVAQRAGAAAASPIAF